LFTLESIFWKLQKWPKIFLANFFPGKASLLILIKMGWAAIWAICSPTGHPESFGTGPNLRPVHLQLHT
jgi:hypothetical protein